MKKSRHTATLPLLIALSLAAGASCRDDAPRTIPAEKCVAWFLDSAEANLRLNRLPQLAGSVSIPKKASFVIDTPVVRLTCPESGYEYSLGMRIPPTIDTARKLPLIVYLHGGTGSDRDDKGSRAWEMFSFIADTMPVILASPSANRFAPWWTAAGMERILQTVRYMTARYPVDPDRIFLAGVSDGAAGCYVAAQTIPSIFAGFLPISGYGPIIQQFDIPLIPKDLAKRHFLIVNGGKDHLYPGNATTAFAQSLKKAGVDITFRLYTNADHGFDYRMMERDSLLAYFSTAVHPALSTEFSWTFLPGLPLHADNIVSAKFDATTSICSLAGKINGSLLELTSHGVREAILVFPKGTIVPKTGIVNGRKKIRVEDVSHKPESAALRSAYYCLPNPPECVLVEVTLLP